eukprot:m.5603 g.5603  ORF g.5603 m.5603 type:complete len:478 (+) comp5068_c0_seq1:266-1699(+)
MDSEEGYVNEHSSLLRHNAVAIFKRRVKRTWWLSVLIVTTGALLLLATVIQAGLTPVTAETVVKDGTHPFTERVMALYSYVGTSGLAAIIGGSMMLNKLSDSKHGHSQQSRLLWGALDLHSFSVTGLAITAVSTIASLIAIVTFQGYDAHETFQFNLTETVGWIIIGCLCLILLGLLSSSELDSRAILGDIRKKTSGECRTVAGAQLMFGVQAVVMAVTVSALDVDKSSALLLLGIIMTFLGGLITIFSASISLYYISVTHWPQKLNLMRLEHTWGISTIAHCCCLVACGMHVYFSSQVIYDCRSETKGNFHPNCDSSIGSVAGLLPYIFSFVSLVMCGITCVVASVKMSKLAHQLTDKTLPNAATHINTAEFQHMAGAADSGAVSAFEPVQVGCEKMTPQAVQQCLESVVAGAGAHAAQAGLSGRAVAMLLRGTQGQGSAVGPDMVQTLSTLCGQEVSALQAAALLDALTQPHAAV